MYFYLAPLDLDPLPYVGMIESELSKFLELQLVNEWRNIREKNKKKVRQTLWEYSDKWYNTPKSFLLNLTPKDWIIIERSYLGDIPNYP